MNRPQMVPSSVDAVLTALPGPVISQPMVDRPRSILKGIQAHAIFDADPPRRFRG